jgi:hypothetical protein
VARIIQIFCLASAAAVSSGMEHEIILDYLKTKRQARTLAREWPFRLILIAVAATMLVALLTK